VLNCQFALTQHPHVPEETISVAEALCLTLSVSRGPHENGSTFRKYQLSGENTIVPPWDYSDTLNISQWMLEELRKRDSPEWYIPSLEELKAEAGIE
jgi:hypothetical protein